MYNRVKSMQQLNEQMMATITTTKKNTFHFLLKNVQSKETKPIKLCECISSVWLLFAFILGTHAHSRRSNDIYNCNSNTEEYKWPNNNNKNNDS